MSRFAPGKTAKELGIDTSRTFEVVIGNGFFSEGEKITFKSNDESSCPRFYKEDKSNSWSIAWYKLKYADEEPVPHWKKYIGNQTAVHVKSEKELRTLLEFLENNTDLRWGGGDKPTEFFPFFPEDQCISIGTEILYATKVYYERHGYKIITLQEFMGEKTVPPAVYDTFRQDLINYHIASNSLAATLPNIIKKTMNYAKEKLLKLTNPNTYALYKAGYTDENGALTCKGTEITNTLLEELVRDKLVELAKEEIEEEKK